MKKNIFILEGFTTGDKCPRGYYIRVNPRQKGHGDNSRGLPQGGNQRGGGSMFQPSLNPIGNQDLVCKL